MPSPLPEPTRRRRRRRRALGVLPTALLSWAVLGGLPFTAADAQPGQMHTEILTLSGPEGQRTAAAGTASRTLRSVPAEATSGWTATLDVADGTQAVGPTWTGAPTGAISVRGQAADGTWTDWQPLAADPEDKPAPDSRDAGGLAWFGHDGVDLLEVQVDAGSLEDLEVQTMRYEEPSSGVGAITAALAPVQAGAAGARPAIVPRSTWTSKGWATANSGCSGGPKEASGGLKFGVVHHTVNSNTYSASDVPALMASIYAYHTGSNGWCDIAYNFIVDRFGRIWEARSGGVDKAIVGGHAQGFNTGSVGVSFLGQFEPGSSPTAAQPAPAAITAAGQLLGWKLGLTGIDPTGKVTVTSGGSTRYPSGTVVTLPRIVGHRDIGYTACPGANLYDDLGTIRTIAKGHQGTTGTTTTTATTAPTTTTTTTPPPTPYPPFATVEAMVRQQFTDVLHRPATAADVQTWTARLGGSWTAGQFVANLVMSTEADAHVNAVIRLYRAYFLRNPDHAGFTFWLNKRDEGRSTASISASFAASAEFSNRYGKLSDPAFVDRVYRNIFGRPADADGARYWTSRLASGVSRGQVMATFSESSEYVRTTIAGVRVTATYEAMLDRAVEPTTYTSYENALNANSISLNTIAGTIFASSEYRNRIT